MPTLETYLTFDGNCAEAMRFYERVLGGKIEMMMTHGESPFAEKTPSERTHQILHARIVIDGRALLGSDMPSGDGAPAPKGRYALSLTYPTVEEAQRVFDALSQGGTIGSPLAETFWAGTWGMLFDKFGTPWMVHGAPKNVR